MAKTITMMVWDDRRKAPQTLSADLNHFPDNLHRKRVQELLQAAARTALGELVVVHVAAPVEPIFAGQNFYAVPFAFQQGLAGIGQAAQANIIDNAAFDRLLRQLRGER